MDQNAAAKRTAKTQKRQKHHKNREKKQISSMEAASVQLL